MYYDPFQPEPLEVTSSSFVADAPPSSGIVCSTSLNGLESEVSRSRASVAVEENSVSVSPHTHRSQQRQGNENSSSFHSQLNPHSQQPQHQHSSQCDNLSLRRDREREGRCSECGAQTHEMRFNPDTGSVVKEPLSVEREVHRGRCLLCHPLPHTHSTGYAQQPQQEMNDGRMSHRGQKQQIRRGSAGRRGYGGAGRGGDGGNNMGGSQSLCDEGAESVQSNASPQSAPLVFHASVASRHATAQAAAAHSHFNHRSHTFESFHSQSRDRDLTPPIEVRAVRMHHSTESTNSAPTGSRSSITAGTSTETPPPISQSAANQETDMCEIISNMRRYPTHVPTQESGCQSLWVLSWDDENAAAIGRVGGVQTILDAMRLHPNVHPIQVSGCAAVQNLALDEYNRDSIAESGGIAVIVDTMRLHVDDAPIQTTGCTALANLANGCVDHKITVAECGGILAVMKAVEHHPEEESVLRAAYQALRMLGYNPAASRGANGGVGWEELGDSCQRDGDEDEDMEDQ